jgi:hypothetical protein
MFDGVLPAETLRDQRWQMAGFAAMLERWDALGATDAEIGVGFRLCIAALKADMPGTLPPEEYDLARLAARRPRGWRSLRVNVVLDGWHQHPDRLLHHLQIDQPVAVSLAQKRARTARRGPRVEHRGGGNFATSQRRPGGNHAGKVAGNFATPKSAKPLQSPETGSPLQVHLQEESTHHPSGLVAEAGSLRSCVCGGDLRSGEGEEAAPQEPRRHDDRQPELSLDAAPEVQSTAASAPPPAPGEVMGQSTTSPPSGTAAQAPAASPMAAEVDAGQERGEIAGPGRPAAGENIQSLENLGVDFRRLAEWRQMREAGLDKLEEAIQAALDEDKPPPRPAATRAGFAKLCDLWPRKDGIHAPQMTRLHRDAVADLGSEERLLARVEAFVEERRKRFGEGFDPGKLPKLARWLVDREYRAVAEAEADGGYERPPDFDPHERYAYQLRGLIGRSFWSIEAFGPLPGDPCSQMPQEVLERPEFAGWRDTVAAYKAKEKRRREAQDAAREAYNREIAAEQEVERRRRAAERQEHEQQQQRPAVDREAMKAALAELALRPKIAIPTPSLGAAP